MGTLADMSEWPKRLQELRRGGPYSYHETFALAILWLELPGEQEQDRMVAYECEAGDGEGILFVRRIKVEIVAGHALLPRESLRIDLVTPGELVLIVPNAAQSAALTRPDSEL
jgi:hypothetical protein